MHTPSASPSPRLLLVEDDDDTRLALLDVLTDRGYRVSAVASAEAALSEVAWAEIDAVLSDVRLPGMDGIELCARLSGDRPDLPVVVMTAFGDVASASSALRAGAFDFLTKPFTVDMVDKVVARALERPRVNVRITRLGEVPSGDGGPRGLVGSSAPMRQVAEQITRAASVDSSVLVTGESGTGKELVARAIHAASERRTGPFVAMSCAAVPQDILESELFGHARGAFTGASDARAGLFQQATGGTLFLDEIGDMPLELQPKLLRALQERSVRPVGAADEVHFDARIIAATNNELDAAVEAGRFRQDLLYRIRVVHIHLPPLRERGWDVIELARHFLASASDGADTCELSPDAERLLLAYHWPGNVRELENCMMAAIALACGGRIGFEELPTAVRSRRAQPAHVTLDAVSLGEIEKKHIELVLRAAGFNKAEAARRLGIDRATLYRKLKRFGLDVAR